jgi:imidazolonepropionase-like amidohydrolase
MKILSPFLWRLGRLVLLLSLAAAALSGCTQPIVQADVDRSKPVLALVNGLLIDGTGSEPVPDAVVLIQDGKILAVGARSRIHVPPKAQVVDVQGGAILPGFTNAHVHDGFNPANLKAWAQGGVTTIRDEGAGNLYVLRDLFTKRDGVLNQPEYARIVSAGGMLGASNGYGSIFVSSEEEARKAILQELNWGADLIKVSEEDGYAGKTGLPRLSSDILQSIVRITHEHGTKVSAHITQAKFMQMVVEAGVDDVAHMAYDPVPAATFEAMVKKDIYLTPTFTVLRDFDAIGASVDNLHQFVAVGGKVALGNDYGGGKSMKYFELGIPMYEIEMMQQAGMTPMQIVVASTLNAAHVCNRDKDLGTLEAGKIADVLVVRGNPLRDLKTLKNVLLVIKGGQLIRQEN